MGKDVGPTDKKQLIDKFIKTQPLEVQQAYFVQQNKQRKRAEGEVSLADELKKAEMEARQNGLPKYELLLD
ncbi:hypothetical protein AAVH_11524 [Aphelenchoides avenae]|nr:hypothetical protein AAVH_11524 [Aphelenchus avenae]